MSALDQVLRIATHPALLALFRDFCVQVRAEENIEFWLDVQRYKKLPDTSERRKLGQQLVNQYINQGAAHELNLDQIVHEKTIVRGLTGDVDAFQDAERAILDLIPRFRSSPKFQQYVTAKRQDEIERQKAQEKEKQRETSKKASQSSPVYATDSVQLAKDFVKHLIVSAQNSDIGILAGPRIALRRLEVRDPRMTDHDLDRLFRQISLVPALSEVLLAHGTFAERGMSILARFLLHHPRVTYFALTDTPLTASFAHYLVDAIRPSHTLTHLSFDRTSIGDEAIRRISEALLSNVSVRHLSLCSNTFGAAGAADLAELARGCASLEVLSLTGNDIKEPSVQLLRDLCRYWTRENPFQVILQAAADSWSLQSMPGVESVENFLKDRQLLRRLKKEETLKEIQSATFYSKSVTELDFSFIDLNTVQSMAVPSAALTKLSFYFANLSVLPAFCRYLPALRSLCVRRNRLTTIPEWLCETTSLTHLDISENHLSDLPKSIGSLKLLRTLLAHSNRLSALPSSFAFLLALRHLDLSRNRFRAIAEDGIASPELEVLRLFANDIKTLPSSLGRLMALKVLDTRCNPMSSYPPQLHPGGAALLEFLRQSAYDMKAVQQIKLLVLGAEGVGKTTLVRALMGLKEDERKLATDGIEIHNGFRVPRCEAEFTLFDFAGQELYYGTHQFFLGGEALHLIMFNLHQPSIESVQYWLQAVRHRAPDRAPYIILVGTHADKFASEAEAEAALADARMRVARRFNEAENQLNIRASIAVSFAVSPGLVAAQATSSSPFTTSSSSPLVSNSLRHLSALIGEAGALLNRRLLPATFFDLQKKIRKVAAEEPVISWDRFVGVAQSCGLNGDLLELSASYLQSMGALLHLSESAELRELVILSPEFLIEIMRGLVSLKHNFVKRGLIRIADLPWVWAAFPRELHDQLVCLLEKFEILFRFPSGISFAPNSGLTIADPVLLIPSLLPKELPTDIQEQVRMSTSVLKKLQNGWTRTFRFSFAPHGFFERVMYRTLNMTQYAASGLKAVHCWATGIHLESPNAYIIITYAMHPYHLTIEAFPLRAGLAAVRCFVLQLQLIEQLIDGAYSQLRATEDYERFIACRCPDAVVPRFWTYDECVAAASTGAQLQCRHGPVAPSDIAPDIAFAGIDIIQKTDLDLRALIGMGSFGSVHLAAWKDQRVAVKTMDAESNDRDEGVKFAAFQREAYMMAELQHPNIVRLFGVALAPPMLVLEYCSGSDLRHLLDERAVEDVGWTFRLRVAWDVSKAMDYLHSLTPPVLHRDLRSPNVFLCSLAAAADTAVVAKVADFGVAQFLAPVAYGTLDSWRWMAPETFSSSTRHPSYSTSADVYSFGMVLWELCTHLIPYDEFMKGGTADFKVRRRIASEGLTPTVPASCPPAVRGIMQCCWSANATLRPTFADLAPALESLLRLQRSTGTITDAPSDVLPRSPSINPSSPSAASPPSSTLPVTIVPSLSGFDSVQWRRRTPASPTNSPPTSPRLALSVSPARHRNPSPQPSSLPLLRALDSRAVATQATAAVPAEPAASPPKDSPHTSVTPTPQLPVVFQRAPSPRPGAGNAAARSPITIGGGGSDLSANRRIPSPRPVSSDAAASFPPATMELSMMARQASPRPASQQAESSRQPSPRPGSAQQLPATVRTPSPLPSPVPSPISERRNAASPPVDRRLISASPIRGGDSSSDKSSSTDERNAAKAKGAPLSEKEKKQKDNLKRLEKVGF